MFQNSSDIISLIECWQNIQKQTRKCQDSGLYLHRLAMTPLTPSPPTNMLPHRMWNTLQIVWVEHAANDYETWKFDWWTRLIFRSQVYDWNTRSSDDAFWEHQWRSFTMIWFFFLKHSVLSENPCKSVNLTIIISVFECDISWRPSIFVNSTFHLTQELPFM